MTRTVMMMVMGVLSDVDVDDVVDVSMPAKI